MTQLLEIGCRSIERALRHGIERGEFTVLPIEATAQALAASVVGNAIWEATFFKFLSPLPNHASHDVGLELAVRGLPRPGAAYSPPTEQVPPAVPAQATDTALDAHGPAVESGKVRIRTLRAPRRAP